MGMLDVLNEGMIETGAWMNIEHPVSGNQMFLNDDTSLPARIRVRSTASTAYKDFQEANRRRNLKPVFRGRGGSDAQIREAAKDEAPKRFSVLVTALENVDQKGIQTPKPDALVAMASRPGTKWLVDAVIAFADDDSNYGDAGDGEDTITRDEAGNAASSLTS